MRQLFLNIQNKISALQALTQGLCTSRPLRNSQPCGNALMPWGGKSWQPDEAEKPFVLQAKLNRSKMQSEIDDGFYTEANLEKLKA